MKVAEIVKNAKKISRLAVTLEGEKFIIPPMKEKKETSIRNILIISMLSYLFSFGVLSLIVFNTKDFIWGISVSKLRIIYDVTQDILVSLYVVNFILIYLKLGFNHGNQRKYKREDEFYEIDVEEECNEDFVIISFQKLIPLPIIKSIKLESNQLVYSESATYYSEQMIRNFILGKSSKTS